MSALAIASTGTPWMWLVSRGSGLALLVCLSAVFVLGVATRQGSAPRAWARFVVAELHRAVALFAVAFLGLHVATAILDPYVSIGWWAAVLPFASHYRAAAIGMGALAVDLGSAILVTSLVRKHIGYRLWRAVHWTAYLALPVAFVHALTAGSDMGIWWVATTVWGSAAVVAVALLARLLGRIRGPDSRVAASASRGVDRDPMRSAA